MFLSATKAHILVLIVSSFGSVCRSSPVLVLISNGSDITINFPGENNNNRMFSIISGSGNNNPSMIDWIGGNGANKAPTIALGQASALESAMQSDSSLENDNNQPPSINLPFRPHSTMEFDENESILPGFATITEAISTNSTLTPSILTKTTDAA